MKNKIINIVILAVAVLASISILVFAIQYDSADPIKSEPSIIFQSISMYVMYILMFSAALAVVGFAIYQLINNFKQAKTSLLGVAVLVGLFLITFVLSSASNSLIEQKFAVSTQLSKVIGAGLLSTYLLMACVVLAIVWSSIASRFKN